jgi:hypothetical protein
MLLTWHVALKVNNATYCNIIALSRLRLSMITAVNLEHMRRFKPSGCNITLKLIPAVSRSAACGIRLTLSTADTHRSADTNPF